MSRKVSESTVTPEPARSGEPEQIKADPPRPRHARRWAMALAPAAPNTEGALVEIVWSETRLWRGALSSEAAVRRFLGDFRAQ